MFKKPRFILQHARHSNKLLLVDLFLRVAFQNLLFDLNVETFLAVAPDE